VAQGRDKWGGAGVRGFARVALGVAFLDQLLRGARTEVEVDRW
jgi:hypothetical protein